MDDGSGARWLQDRYRLTPTEAIIASLLIALLGVLLRVACSAQVVTTLVSANRPGNASANGASHSGAITPDGRYVVFASAASNLVAHDTNGASDVFVRNLTAGTTTLVSVDTAGNAAGNGHSFSSAVSADGRYVVFRSDASNLVTTPKGNATACNGGHDSCNDAFVRDLRPASLAPSLPGSGCIGDCSGNMEVTVDELLVMVNVAQDTANLSACGSGDASGDGLITVEEILAAVNAALSGCH